MPFKNPHPLYSVWQSMRRRCLTPTAKQFDDYGGRGIKICPEWDDFHQFVADMGPKPPQHSLDRKDNDGHYTPDNCKWSSRKDQQRNQRRTRHIILGGKLYSVAKLAETYGLKADTIVDRHAKGMSYDEVTAKTRYTFTGGLAKAVAVRVANQIARTHCKYGHEFTPENTYVYGTHRACRTCIRLKEQRRRARLRKENAA